MEGNRERINSGINSNPKRVYSTDENRKVYDENKLEYRISINHNVLDFHYKITEKESNIITENLAEIVDYIAIKKAIPKSDHARIGRVMRIAYFEYMEFLSIVIPKNPAFDNPDPGYRKNRRLVQPLNPFKKREILAKYLRMYENYEKTFRYSER